MIFTYYFFLCWVCFFFFFFFFFFFIFFYFFFFYFVLFFFFFFFSSRRRHTRCGRDWSSDVCSSDLDRITQRVVGGSRLRQRQQGGEHRVAHLLAVDALHRSAERRRHLQQVGHPADIGGPVVPGGVEQGRVEERRVALRQRQLYVVLVEVRPELRPPPGQVAGLVLLRVRQIHRRARLHRHVGVGDRSLQGQHRREAMHVGGVLRGQVVGLEAEVVVPVCLLCRAARIDHVDLRGDLVVRAEPGRADQGDDVVGVIVGEYRRLADRQLLQGVPHPVVGARLREMVAGGRAAGPLVGDHRVERVGGTVDHRQVGERPLEHHQAGAVHQRTREFGLDLPMPSNRAGVRPHPVAVVDQHVLLYSVGVRVVAQHRGAADEHHEIRQPAVVLGQP